MEAAEPSPIWWSQVCLGHPGGLFQPVGGRILIPRAWHTAHWRASLAGTPLYSRTTCPKRPRRRQMMSPMSNWRLLGWRHSHTTLSGGCIQDYYMAIKNTAVGPPGLVYEACYPGNIVEDKECRVLAAFTGIVNYKNVLVTKADCQSPSH